MTQEQTKNKRHRSRRCRSASKTRELPDIFFCGDPHGGFDQINEAARLYHPDAMVILGDLQPPAPLEQVLEEALCYTDIWWIPGNHDTDTDAIYDNLWRSGLRDHNLHGRSVMIHGVRIAGLGGVFRGQVWMPDDPPNYYSPSALMRRIGSMNIWRGGVPRRHRSTIFPSVYNNMFQHLKADVLVTHEAPGCHRKGFCALDKLARSMGVKWMFHGHQHEDRCYHPINGVQTRAVGYRGVVNLKGEVVISAQLDPREAAALEDAFDWEERELREKDKIIVRDEDGAIHIVPKTDGVVPAILPKCCTLVPVSQEAGESKKVAQETAKKSPNGQYRPAKTETKAVHATSAEKPTQNGNNQGERPHAPPPPKKNKRRSRGRDARRHARPVVNRQTTVEATT